jgi:ADP-ribose pyrophosphatase YjhB (NUDIX family)
VSGDKTCDNASVGVLIESYGRRGAPRWLFTWRNTFPFSVAPVSGHVFDEHGDYRDAAVAEVKEEVGLTVEELYPTMVGGWQPNRCCREPGPAGTGHAWQVFTATVSGELKPSDREVRQARWLLRDEVQLLANRTMLHAQGRVRAADFTECPGIEPVWVGFLAELDVIRMPVAGVELVRQLMAEGRTLT